MYGIELLIADRAIIEAIAVYKPISIQFFPVFFLCFIYLLVKQTMPPKPLIFLLLVVATAIGFSMITNDHHHFAWSKTLFVTTKEGFNYLILVPGLWIKLMIVFYHYGVDLIIVTLLIKAGLTHKQTYRAQFLLILAFILIIVFFVNTLYIFQIVSFEPYNPVPVVVGLASMMVAVAISKYRLLSIIPYAREYVFDIIDSPVIIADNNDIVVDFNSPASKILRLSDNIIGLHVKDVFNLLRIDWQELKENEPKTIYTKWGGTGENYLLNLLKKKNIKHGDIEGSLIIFNDITAQMNAVATAHEKKEIITYKESILGDMHDGIGGVVATGTILAQAALDDEDIASKKNQKIAQIAHLLENGSFELRSMLNILDKKNKSTGIH